MEDFLWWRDGVIYQIYPRSFADANGDGIGDLRGLIDRLDYLNGAPGALGVDAIWLSPIYPSPGLDFGYDVSDYEDIDPMFGSLEDFDQLVTEAHRRGIRVIMDLVMNHTSHLHPWFVESRSSRSSPKRDWYLWRDPAPGGGPPNNWQAVFGGRAWEWDAATGQYYYHMFLQEQPDLNWRNPEVQARMLEMVRFWLERGVDGFRLDVVNTFFKDEALRNNPIALGLRAFDRQKHVYDRDRPEMAGVLQAFRRLLDTYPDRMSVGEVFATDPLLAARYCGTGADQLHLAFNLKTVHLPWRAKAFQDAVLEWEGALHAEAWPCHVLSNHDIGRHATRFGGVAESDARARVAAALLLTLRGTPFLYYGEEIGLRDTPIPRLEIQDPPGKRYWPLYKGRDAERTPMPWNAGRNAGFTPGRPWLRLNPDFATRNVEAQQADAESVFHFYRQLISLRRASIALRRGEWIPLQRKPGDGLVYLRRCPEQTVLVALNFTGKEIQLELDEPISSGWRRMISSVAGGDLRLRGRKLELAPFEAGVWEEGKG